MRVAQINADGYCYAVSDIAGGVAPEGTIALEENENPLGRMRNSDGVWSDTVYVAIQPVDPAAELAALKAKLLEKGIEL